MESSPEIDVQAASELRPGNRLQGASSGSSRSRSRHREGLREAAERDPQIHRYTNMYSLGFDGWFDLALGSESEIPFVVWSTAGRSDRPGI